MGEQLWGIMTIAGPIILLVLFVWVVVRSSRRRPGEPPEEVTERATERVYKEEEQAREHKEGDA